MSISDSLPILALPASVLFPYSDLPLRVVDNRNKVIIPIAMESSKLVGVALAASDPWEKRRVSKQSVHCVGVLAAISSAHLLPDGNYNIYLKGMDKIHIERVARGNRPYLASPIRPFHEEEPEEEAIAPYRKEISELFDKVGLSMLFTNAPKGTRDRIRYASPANLVALTAALLGLKPHELQNLLECDDTADRMKFLIRNFHTSLLNHAAFGDFDPDEGNEFSH